MGSKIEYVDSSQLYATNYVRNAKAVGVLWGIFTVCYTIIVAVAFITPEWMGDTTASENPARFGLWSSCYFGNGVSSAVEDCQGKMDDLSSIPSVAIRAAAILGGISVCVAIVVVAVLLLFFFVQSTTVYLMCAWLHILSGLCFFTRTSTYYFGLVRYTRLTKPNFSTSHNIIHYITDFILLLYKLRIHFPDDKYLCFKVIL